MRMKSFGVLALAAMLLVLVSERASAQTPQAPSSSATAPAPQGPATQVAPAATAAPAPAPATPSEVLTTTPCGTPLSAPAALPPAGSPPFVWILQPCFDTQGNTSTVEPETYMYYIKTRPSQPSQGVWVYYTDQTEEQILNDFKTLWGTSFLDNLSIEKTDYTFPTGQTGVILTYHMEERERVKLVEYTGSKVIDRTKIDEQLSDRGITVRLDSFLDESVIRRVEGVLRQMMAEKGFTNAEVTHKITPVSGGPKLVNVTFNISEGPKIKLRRINFIGNQAISDGRLARKMKENKAHNWLSWIRGTGTYKEDKFEDDAQKITDYYHEKGYARAHVGTPELKTLENSKDGKTRWVELRIPITEGPRYKLDDFGFDGNTVVKSDLLRPMFKVEKGDWYNEKKIRDGLKKAQEAYGSGGYMEFTGFPDLKYSDDPTSAQATLTAQVPPALLDPGLAQADKGKTPTVDVTMRLNEGKQYFVNRIVFTGNTNTRDNVIRREMMLLEGAPFNTEALKNSVKRINQLAYFKPLEGNEKDMKVDKTPGRDNAVDVTLKVQEQNRNQLTFGAGVSQYEGVFGQLGFQTSNFMGRGETLTMSVQAGSLAQNYELGFTEPFLFDRPMTGGFDLHKSELQYIGYYTQKSAGGNVSFGWRLKGFSQLFTQYSYDQVQMTNLSEALIDQSCVFRPTGCATISSINDLSALTPTQRQLLQQNPFVYDSLLVGSGGVRTISKITPTFVYNTVDNPIFPTQGRRYTASLDLAVLGGNTQFWKPSLEGVWIFKQSSRTSLAFRAQAQYIAPLNGSSLPIFERLWLGGEYSIRGFDLRSIGPTVPGSQVVLGGNKSLLFNAEYMINIAGPVRLILFYDAGEVRDIGQSFVLKQPLTQLVLPPSPLLTDPLATVGLVDPNAPIPHTEAIGTTSAIKTSTGAEIRFFMPVLNVPFRLIFAENPQRGGVLNDQLLPQKAFTFRFAVGTTF